MCHLDDEELVDRGSHRIWRCHSIPLSKYLLRQPEDDIEEKLARLGAEQELTDQGLSDTSAEEVSEIVQAGSSLGSAAAGGQTVRLLDQSRSTPTSGEDPDTTGSEDVPADLFDDRLRLLGDLDLTNIQVADPVGPILIDLCAGRNGVPRVRKAVPSGSAEPS